MKKINLKNEQEFILINALASSALLGLFHHMRNFTFMTWLGETFFTFCLLMVVYGLVDFYRKKI